MPKFLHTADWQMGRAFSRFETEDGAALVEARFEAIEKIARLANEHQCDAVLVAGDVFDAQTVADRTIRRVFNATGAFSGPWVMLPGNHDAALAESVWTRAQRLGAVPDNVHAALEPGVINLEPQGLAILCAPLTQRNTYSDLTEAFSTWETPERLIRVGLAHGSVQGVLSDDIDSANPISPNRAEAGRLDYLALGDWHGTRQVDGRTWYSGTPEPERFRNNSAGYALIVDVPGPGALPQVTPLETGRYQWHQWRETLTVESDLDQLLERLGELPEPSVVDLRLEGAITLAGEERLTNALSVAEARFRSIQCDRSGLQLAPTDDDVAALKADGYVGEVIEHLRSHQQDDDAEAARDALAILAGLLKDRKQETSE
ncbi:metallophosphoesterase family protein [Marinobacter subterrani]|uniref:metallophosphoesterase family protein n=1 Tax=Marinobacter subterrani TaxID=1658765 RepID=UPI002353A3AA|nr:DNA repair exonuclease [Marinobacter subterrani]